MKRCLTIAAMLLAAACSQQEQQSAPLNDAASAQPAAVGDQATPSREGETVEPSLAGEWQVTALDGRPIGPVTASFQGDKVSLASGCFRRAWTYTQKRNVVAFTSNPAGSANCGGGVPGEKLEAAYVALEKATMAIFSEDGREANLSGYGGGLTLERR